VLRVLCKCQVQLSDLAEHCIALRRGLVKRSKTTLRLVPGDQLSPGLSALAGLAPALDVVLMA